MIGGEEHHAIVSKLESEIEDLEEQLAALDSEAEEQFRQIEHLKRDLELPCELCQSTRARVTATTRRFWWMFAANDNDGRGLLVRSDSAGVRMIGGEEHHAIVSKLQSEIEDLEEQLAALDSEAEEQFRQIEHLKRDLELPCELCQSTRARITATTRRFWWMFAANVALFLLWWFK